MEDLVADPENEKWLSISTEFCGGIKFFHFSTPKTSANEFFNLSGTHISNTREAKAFALLSEEGIAKGVRRITAVTTECAINAADQARSFDLEIDEASQTNGNSFEKVSHCQTC